MDLHNIRQKLLRWKDFYGQDIVYTDEIKKAKNKKMLKEILQKHIDFLRMQNIDAICHAEQFIDEIFN